MAGPPDYEGRGLVNLVAEIEARLSGGSASPRLDPALRPILPPARTYVLVLFDGLGADQLRHERAGALSAALRSVLDAPFPSTTTVSMATVATGLAPRRHGIIGYHMWFEHIAPVVNVLRGTTRWGDPIELDFERLLPGPNLWERLGAAGVEPVTVQPGDFSASPLSRMLYRGCRFEAAWSEQEIVSATLDLAAAPGRLVFTYVPHVDVAAHMSGQGSSEYAEAVATVAKIWEAIAVRLPSGAALVGTADHGHVDFSQKVQVEPASELEFAGDPRALYVRGSATALATLDGLPAEVVGVEQLRALLGPRGPDHPRLEARLPDLCLLPRPGIALLPPAFGVSWVGFHGGLTPEEREVPLLVG